MSQFLTVDGRVEKGEGMATKLGCPTANIAVEQGAIIPALGVYVGMTLFEGNRYPSLICINDGRTGLNLKMEVHLMDQTELQLTNKYIRVMLYEKIRDLIPFPGDEEMTRIIQQDLTNAKQWFARSSTI